MRPALLTLAVLAGRPLAVQIGELGFSDSDDVANDATFTAWASSASPDARERQIDALLASWRQHTSLAYAAAQAVYAWRLFEEDPVDVRLNFAAVGEALAAYGAALATSQCAAAAEADFRARECVGKYAQRMLLAAVAGRE